MSENVFTEWFVIILDKHREKWRAYHTVIHLVEMLRYLEMLSDECLSMNEEEKSILIMATFFHDSIYDPKSQSNEEDSAKLYQDFCSKSFENGEKKSQIVSIFFVMASFTEVLRRTFCNNMAQFQGILGVFHWTFFGPFWTVS